MSLQIDDLFRHPEYVSTVASWIHGEFWADKNVHTPDSLEQLLRDADSGDRLPISLVALINDQPVGTVNLVDNDDDRRPHLRPWLAALFVAPTYRRRGVGSALVQALRQRAAELGIRDMFLGTDNPRFYLALGAEVHEQVREDFCIMRIASMS